MSDKELLLLIYNDTQSIKSDLQSTKEDVQALKTDMQAIKTDMQALKADVQALKADVQFLKQDVSDIKLHLENVTDKNITLLVENHVMLINKLNQAVPAANKNLVYEVKVNYLIEKVDKLKKASHVHEDKTA